MRVATKRQNPCIAQVHLSTGEPNGIPLSHENIAFQIRAITEIRLIGTADRILLPLPLHHIYPFTIGMLFPLASGLPIILPKALTGPDLLSALREGDVMAIIGVP